MHTAQMQGLSRRTALRLVTSQRSKAIAAGAWWGCGCSRLEDQVRGGAGSALRTCVAGAAPVATVDLLEAGKNSALAYTARYMCAWAHYRAESGLGINSAVCPCARECVRERARHSLALALPGTSTPWLLQLRT